MVEKRVPSEDGGGPVAVPAVDLQPATERTSSDGGLFAPAAHGPRIQFKLAVGAVDDPAERDADRMADAIVASLRAPAPSEADEGSRVRRGIARASVGPEGGDVDAQTESRIRRSGSGETLDPTLRRSIEPVLGADLSHVRIHRSSRIAPGLNARAFTHGGDVHFAPGEYAPHTSAGLHLLGHELTHTVQQDTSVRRAYADLEVMGQKRVDAMADQKYAKKAKTFEHAIGPVISRHPHANHAVDVLMNMLREMVNAWATHTGQNWRDVYVNDLSFAESEKYYGAFEKTADSIHAVLSDYTKPLRVKLHLVYNAVRNNTLSKYLEVAALELTREMGGDTSSQTIHSTTGKLADGAAWADANPQQLQVQSGFAAASGLDDPLNADGGSRRDAMSAIAEGRKWSFADGSKASVFGSDTFSGVMQPNASLIEANKSRDPGQNAGLSVFEQRTLKKSDVPDLTPEELALLERRHPGATAALGGGAATTPVAWEQGREFYDVKLGSAVDREAAKIKARLEAGISGSTDLMIHAAENLGLSYEQKLRLRLAMLGWMLSNRDHSFFEIMTSAANYNLPFAKDEAHPGKEYEEAGNFWPMDVDTLRAVLPENEFPRYFLGDPDYASRTGLGNYKDVLAGSLADPGHGAGDLRDDLRASGVPDFIVDRLSEHDLAHAAALKARVRDYDAKFMKRDALAHDLAEVNAGRANKVRLRYLKEDAAYGALVRSCGGQAEILLEALIRNVSGDSVLPGNRPPHIRVLAEALAADHALLPVHLAPLGDAAIRDLHAFARRVQAEAFGGDEAANGNVMSALWTDPVFTGLRGQFTDEWGHKIIAVLVRKHHGGVPLAGAAAEARSAADRRVAIELIAQSIRTTGRWYSWGNLAYLHGFASTSDLGRHARAATRSPQGYGLYVSNVPRGSQGYGAAAGCGIAVVDFVDVPTMDSSDMVGQRPLLALLDYGGKAMTKEDLYRDDNYGDFLFKYQGQSGAFTWARLTTSHGVTVNTDLSRIPPAEVRAIYDGVTDPQARANLHTQATNSHVDTTQWPVP